MITDTSQIIVSEGDCICDAVRTVQVHHREFPEVWGAGCTAEEGTYRLVHMLELFLEGAASDFRRTAIQQALADVRAFKESLVEVEATS